MRISKFSIINILLVWAYIYCLVYTYTNTVYVNYSYMGFQINENINFSVIVFISIVLAFFSLYIPRVVNKPSDLLIIFTYYFILIPNTLMPYIANKNGSQYWVDILFYFSVCMATLLFVTKIKIRNIKYKLNIKNIENKILYFVVFLVFVVVLFYKPKLSNILNLVSLVDLYDWRDDYREKTKNVPKIIEYMFNWSSKIFIPLMLLYGLFNKKISFIVGAFFLNICLFVVSGHKSIFFGCFFILSFYYLFNKSNRTQVIVSPFLVLVYFSTFIYVFFKETLFLDIFVRRMMHIPGMLAGFYYEYFNEFGFSKYSYNILQNITFTNYTTTPPYLIGDYYFKNDGVNANAGYLTAAYAEYGFFGGWIVAIIVGFYFKTIDSLIIDSKNNKVFMILIFLLPTWALVNSAFNTVLITHGLLISTLFVVVLKDREMKIGKI